jgi:hypothetical protein
MGNLNESTCISFYFSKYNDKEHFSDNAAVAFTRLRRLLQCTGNKFINCCLKFASFKGADKLIKPITMIYLPDSDRCDNFLPFCQQLNIGVARKDRTTMRTSCWFGPRMNISAGLFF